MAIPKRVAIYVYIFNRVHSAFLLRRSGLIVAISFIVVSFLMLNNLGNVSLYLISMANIARFLGFILRLVCFVRGNNLFKVFLFVLGAETVFLASFRLFWR